MGAKTRPLTYPQGPPITESQQRHPASMLCPPPTSGNSRQLAASTFIRLPKERRPTLTPPSAAPVRVWQTACLCLLPPGASLTSPEWTLSELDVTLRLHTDTCYRWVRCQRVSLNACYRDVMNLSDFYFLSSLRKSVWLCFVCSDLF